MIHAFLAVYKYGLFTHGVDGLAWNADPICSAASPLRGSDLRAVSVLMRLHALALPALRARHRENSNLCARGINQVKLKILSVSQVGRRFLGLWEQDKD